MKLRIFFVTCLLAAGMVACSTSEETSSAGETQVTAEEPRHVKVYFEKGMFGGWPATHGIWGGGGIRTWESYSSNSTTSPIFALGRIQAL